MRFARSQGDCKAYFGLEDAVKDRTAKLFSDRTIEVRNKQRKELETQLVHAQKMEVVGQLASELFAKSNPHLNLQVITYYS